MPPRTFALDLSRCSSYVCKSCLDTLRPVRARPPWLARPSSSAARRPQPPPPNPRKDDGKPDPADLERILLEEFDRGPDPSSSAASGPLDVNFFNQDGPGGQLHRLRDNDEFGEVSSGLDSEIATAIDTLEKQMKDTAKMLQRMEKQGGPGQDKADELRKQFKKTLRLQYKGKTGPEAEEYGMLRISGFSGPRQRTVANLNTFLARDSVVKGGIPKAKDLAECWKYYSGARKTLSLAWQNVPQEVWNFLWMILSFQGEGVENPNRMQHIYLLAKDMQSAGVPLRDSQQLLAIEAMFIEGWEEEAIEAWKKAVVTLGAKPDTFADYYELGVRMCCLHGDTERAQRAAETLLKSAHPPNARILLPIIRALAARKTTIDQAWESYAQMRTLLGETMTIDDYDEVVAVFLTSDCVEYALQSFVDMMFSRAIDIRGKTRLPLTVGNHFFIGKWLKRLIGVGDLEGAYKVVVFVQNRGITPSPIQLNGLIGAWLRSGSAENVEKGETLAWSMIRARLDYVKLRQRRDVVKFYDPYDPVPEPGEAEAEYVCRTRATAETFSILAENYCSRRLHGRLQEVIQVLNEAEIGPTSFLMNQVIRSYSQNGEADEAVNLYHTMTTEQNIRPDGHTFLTLFNSLSVNRLIQRDPDLSRKDITAARHFFRDMVHAEWTFDSPEIFAQLPRTVLFSLLKAKDYRGVIVAAKAMRELFAFHPPESLLIELATGAGSLHVKTKRNTERLVIGRRTIETLMKRHRKALIECGHPGVEMTDEEKVDELHDVLEKLILLKAGAQNAPLEEVRPLLEEAAREMGVYDIVFAGDAEQIAKHRKLGKQMMGGLVG
jgi:pentatricopeptide repeat protein